MKTKSTSSPIRVLVLGATGQVARQLHLSCPADITLRCVTRVDVDLSDLDSLAVKVEDLIQAFKPDFIVNAAAYTEVDKAESDVATAHAVNGIAPGIIAQVAAQSNVPMIHYSTDYVFDGNKPEPYVEKDSTGPLSVYGSSKLAGEKAILSCLAQAIILRTSWVFSAYGSNFLKTMLRLACERSELKVVDDQVGSPTSACLIAGVTFQIIRKMSKAVESDPRWGIYHLTASSCTSWHGYASYLIERARALGFPVKVKAENILPVPSSQFPSVAKRPRNSRLSTEKLQSVFGIVLPDWRKGVDEVLETLKCES